MEGLLNFYVYIHNAANLPQECFFVRFVCFSIPIRLCCQGQARKSNRRLFFHQILQVVFPSCSRFFHAVVIPCPTNFPLMKKSILLLFVLTPVCLLSQNRYDVVISEIMADPSPAIGLPNYEWIELKNNSGSVLNLQHWRIGDATGISGPLPAVQLQPDSFLVLCSGTALAAMSAISRAVAVTGFPSLDNDEDLIYIRTASGSTMHAVGYTKEWYRNEIKKEGGWTLEMIDPETPCAGSHNWMAGTHPSGGSPGRINSVNKTQPDQEAPVLRRAYLKDSSTVVLVLNEPIDSLRASIPAQYSIDGGISITAAIPLPPLFDQVQIRLSSPMQPHTIYTLTAGDLKDCAGNPLRANSSVRTGIPADPASGEWIINEVMFNPVSNGYDYVEFLNNSKKIVDASRLFIANRNSSGAISSAKPLSNKPWYIFPGEYVVETENAERLALYYFVKNPDHVLVVDVPPTFPDDEGKVLALNFQGQIIDELHYHKDWHFKLIDHEEGVSLERIDPNAQTQEKTNWHSAASTAGYGTPTQINSQYKQVNSPGAAIIVTPLLFSPDNDGRDDFVSIQYKMTEQGYVANITLFNTAGEPVRSLVRNAILGWEGYWNWDGLDDRGQKLPVGNYIVLAEVFNLKGTKKQFKQVLTLARYLQ